MKEVLAEQFDACYDENAWFAAAKSALEGVTAEQAAWKPAGVDNSIWENVNHLVFWNERWLQRYRGELNYPEDVENTSTFKSEVMDEWRVILADSDDDKLNSFKSDETNWTATVNKLYEVMDEWREILADIDDDKLNSPVNAQYQSPWRSPLAHQNIHNAYHIGQIVLLRKLQGAWDAAKGVS